MLIIGIIIGLAVGVLFGLLLSFPLGSAFGMIIDRFFSGWELEIEIILLVICAFTIIKFLNMKWKNS